MEYEKTRNWVEFLGVHEQLGPVGQGYGIEQNPHELSTFLCALPEIKTVLEIGTGYKSGLTRLMAEGLGWIVTTVDANEPQIRSEAARHIIGRSLDVVGKVYGKYDLVILDAGHDYDSVKLDTDLYASMGEIVMYHDIAGMRGCEGAARYWKEISRNEDGNIKPGYHEIIDDSQYGAGIGWYVKAELNSTPTTIYKITDRYVSRSKRNNQ